MDQNQMDVLKTWFMTKYVVVVYITSYPVTRIALLGNVFCSSCWYSVLALRLVSQETFKHLYQAKFVASH